MAKTFNALQFIMDGVSNDETRYYMNAPYWSHEDRALVSTDGRRMHILRMDDETATRYGLSLTESYYVRVIPKENLILKSDKQEGQFPNWKRVEPNYPKPEGEEKSLQMEGKPKGGDSPESNFLRFCVNERTIINPEYAKPLTGKKWTARTGGTEKAVEFLTVAMQGECKAIIMPMMKD